MNPTEWLDLFHRLTTPGCNDLSDADLSGADLRRADLSDADLRRADLRRADLRRADLSGANLRRANLSGANLSGADLSDADLSDANLSGANLSGADLSDANLSGANLSGADLRRANLRRADLSGVLNMQSIIDYITTHFETTDEGIIVYKVFGEFNHPKPDWVIDVGSILTEVVNPDRGTDCGSGVNVGTLSWVKNNTSKRPVWKCLVRWSWLCGVVVPFNTDGKIRCERVELIGPVEPAGNEATPDE